MKTLIVLVLAGLLGTAHAQPFRDGGRPHDRGGRLHARLGLDSATADKIDRMRDEHRKSQIALRAKLQTARIDMRGLMREDTPDRAKILARQKEIEGVRSEMAELRLTHKLDVRALLTPEQRKIMKDRLGDGRGFRDGAGRKFMRREMREGGMRGKMDRRRRHDRCCY